MKNTIQIRGVKKVFKQYTSPKNVVFGRSALTKALNGISINIREGEIFGLLGPNGAGKTTLIKVLTTLILPTEGTATICGYDIINDGRQVRNIIGLIHSDERSFFWRLTGRQNLEFFAAIYKIPKRIAKSRIDEVIAQVGLQNHAENLFHNYSTGMKQRLAIARGLLNRPRIMFLDEAMRSIDPISTRKIREFIKTMVKKKKGITVVMATNRLDEAADLCDRIAILNRGKIIKCGGIQGIDEVFKGSIQYEIVVKNIKHDVIEQIRRMRWIHDCKKMHNSDGKIGIMVTLDEEQVSIHLVLKEIIENDGYIIRCDRREPSLDESFDRIITEFETHQDGNRI
jgi:ABC-2 type transport system ATP-binding protein